MIVRVKIAALGIILIMMQSCNWQIKNGKEELKFLNGQIEFEYNYQNGVLNGPYKAFYENGQLRAEGQYVSGNLDGPFKRYTQDGKLATDEIWKSNSLYFQKIYWQPIPFDDQHFIFVSDSGFVRMKSGTFINLDSTTPDNIMEESFDGKIYIWKNGKKVLYK